MVADRVLPMKFKEGFEELDHFCIVGHELKILPAPQRTHDPPAAARGKQPLMLMVSKHATAFQERG